MKSSRIIVRLLVVCLIILIFVGLSSFAPQNLGKQNQQITLFKPPFIDIVQAASVFDEAGISAWMKSTSVINLTTAKTACSTIELLTTDYFICSIDLGNYEGIYDPHVYVHKDGWIMAYYMRSDPISKIIDVVSRSINSTLLNTAISKIVTAAGIPAATVSFYDFRYPDATHMMFIAENSDDGNYFTIQTPSDYSIFERSWASGGVSTPDLIFDGTNLNPTFATWTDYYMGFGYIPISLFTDDVPHDLSVSTFGVVVLMYQVP